jgi:hypothetical protein
MFQILVPFPKQVNTPLSSYPRNPLVQWHDFNQLEERMNSLSNRIAAASQREAELAVTLNKVKNWTAFGLGFLWRAL